MMRDSRILPGAILLALSAVLVAGCSPNAATTEPESAVSAAPDQSPTRGPEADSAEPANGPSCEDPFDGIRPAFDESYWPQTDFCQHTVPLTEFFAGGPPPDGIRPIDSPRFESVTAADGWLGEGWPVMVVEMEGTARAYPLAMLILHEIVNDTLGDQPIAVTYCPLCNAAITFHRQLPDGRVLDFGTTGNLRNSDLVMYDRQTQSWWQQVTGEAVVGALAGTRLELLPSQTVAWSEFRDRYPQAEVLSRESIGGSYLDRYGFNPYGGYDGRNASPLRGFDDDRLPAMDRVAGVQVGGESIVFPFSELSKSGVANADLGQSSLVAFWHPAAQSMLDSARLDLARQVGSSAVFNRQLGERVLTFEASAATGEFMDQETGSLWNIFGEAIDGPLAGARLEPMVAGEHFWFAWAAFFPDSEIWKAP